MKPYFQTIPNPNAAATFTHLEIQAVQEHSDFDGGTYFEPVQGDEQDSDSAIGKPVFGVYGHITGEGVEHICDRATAQDACDTINKLLGTNLTTFMKPTTLNFCGIPFTGCITREQYQSSGNAALEFVDEAGENIGTLTFNPHQYVPLDANECVIKDYSENEGIFGQLLEQGIVRDTGRRVPSGFIVAPIVEILHAELRR